jgi:hypothetical protein
VFFFPFVLFVLQYFRFGLIWLVESTAGWFFVREKDCWLADLADNLKRTVYQLK